MSDESGWAFLVARGARKGYRTVLAPDFLVRTGRHALLTERIGGTISNTATSIEHITDDEVVGGLTISYRVEPAPAAMLGHAAEHGQQALLDQHGRPLEMLYGVVTTRPVSAGDEDMKRARAEAVDSYRRFLADEDTVTVQSSASFPLRRAMPAAPRMLPAPEVAHTAAPTPRSILSAEMSPSGASVAGENRVLSRPTLYRPVVLLGLLIVLVVVSFVGLRALRGDDTADEVNVRVQDLSERAGSKKQPLCVDVHVRITADGPTTVTYHWKVDGELVSPSASHTFDGPDELTVDAPTSYPSGNTRRADDDGTATRTYELVVTTRTDSDEWQDHDNTRIECLAE